MPPSRLKMSHLSLRRLQTSDDAQPLFCANNLSPSTDHFELIFVIDTSGSMHWTWSQLAKSVNRFIDVHANSRLRITIIQYARHVSVVSSWLPNYTPLNEDFHYSDLDQSRDDIYLAFSTVKEHIHRRRAASSNPISFCVCYIADGGDTESGCTLVNRLMQLKSDSFNSEGISFTSVACGASFPTHISVTLRSLFHDTDIVGLPLLTLVSHDPCDFEARFNELTPHLLANYNQYLDVSPPVNILPWTDRTRSRVCNGSWFTLENPEPKNILLNNVSVPVLDTDSLRDDLNSVGRQWVRHLQTIAACNTRDVHEQARKALVRFQNMLDDINDRVHNGNHPTSVPSSCSTHTLFNHRLHMKREKTTDSKARNIINELKALAFSALQDLTDEQLALRLAIGTRESKYLEKAVRWKGALTIDEFLRAKENFKKLYLKQLEKLRECENKDPFRSNVSLESNVDILIEKTFLENLCDPLISSHYMLIECFPVVGLGLKTYVSEGTTINPWLVRVDAVSRVVSYVDTASIYALTVGETTAKISTGADEYEEISAVCPLMVPETATALGPILRSKLYQIILTFQVTRNMDTVDTSAHLALLAALLTYLVGLSTSNWRDELLETVTFTAKALLEKSGAVKESGSEWKTKFIEVLRTKPNLALVTAHPDLETKCESISKALLAYALLFGANMMDEDARLHIWERIMAEFVGRAVQAGGDERGLERWFELSGMEFEGIISLDQALGSQGGSLMDMNRFASVADAARFIQRSDMNLDEFKLNFSGVHFKADALKKARASSHGPVYWNNLERFELHYVGTSLTCDEDKLRSYVVHGLKYHGSYERGIHDIQRWEEVEDNVLMRLAEISKRHRVNKMKAELVLQAQNRMTNHMRAAHDKGIVLPMTVDEIRQQRNERYGLQTSTEDLKKMRYDEETGLCRAACQNDQCWRFLLVDPKFSEHLENTSPTGGHPVIAFHRTVQNMSRDSPEKITESIIGGRFAKTDVKRVAERNRELCREIGHDYVLRIRAAYRRFERLKSG